MPNQVGVSSLWMSTITTIALPIHLAFTLFRTKSTKKADANLQKLMVIYPALRLLYLVSRADPCFSKAAYPTGPRTALADGLMLTEKELNQSLHKNPEQWWVSQIQASLRRNVQNGNIPTLTVEYMVFWDT